MSVENDIFGQLMALLNPVPSMPLELREAAETALEHMPENKPRFIYRVEDKRTRRGPYNSNLRRKTRRIVADKLKELHSNSNYPGITPIVAMIPSAYKNGEPRAKAAVKTLKELRAWFGELVDDLDRAGYVVAMYKAKQWVDWKKQVVFNPSQSRRVGVFPVNILKSHG